MSRETRGAGSGATTRGFAGMDQEKQREIARKGGANVPNDKRSFAQNRALASEAGRKGGRSVAPQDRSFAQNRALAAAAGRKGGQASQSRRLNNSNTNVNGTTHGKE
jgi:general stress protein YciG